MKRLRITIFDLVTKGPSGMLYTRVINPNSASIMPQVVAVWCEQLGHDVQYVCYTGTEQFSQELLDETDVLIIGAFSRAAQAAYAISNLFRQHGAVTVLGGPHARCYPQDAVQYFDYVLGFTDKTVIDDVLRDCEPHRPIGLQLSAARQPADLPGVQERWKFIETTLAKAHVVKVVPMIGSMGCPYTCSFCIDSHVDFQPLAFDTIREDLQFLLGKMTRPCVAWHDPLFGVRFDNIMTTIEEAVPPNRIDFIAEMSLSLLSEKNLQRLQKNGFKALLPGIESWYTLGNKAKTGQDVGFEKLRQVSEHINMILRYVPYVQTNFVLGLDCDQGAEPFELTKRFLDLTPGAFPAFSMFTAYGEAAPLNLELQREGRILPLPFHFLDTHWMNVQPKNYTWPEFYRYAADLAQHALSWPLMYRRFRANRGVIPTSVNVLRALSSGRIKRLTKVSGLLESDTTFRGFFEGESNLLPGFFEHRLRSQLGPLWESLPPGALMHDPNAYLKATAGTAATSVTASG